MVAWFLCVCVCRWGVDDCPCLVCVCAHTYAFALLPPPTQSRCMCVSTFFHLTHVWALFSFRFPLITEHNNNIINY
jgi:hypothetical protein